ncbi:MAG: RagB/SusD family nutrient uptake outer membrane protein [Bacteroidota bacterium]
MTKLYLNAEVYIDEAKYTEALTYANKVISSAYALHPVYEELFMADNHNADGIIFPVTFDGVHTRTWGGMTFLIHAAVGGNMVAADYGVDGGWNGLRITKEAVSKFQDISGLKGARDVASLKSANDYQVIYVPGGHQGWDPATAPTLASVNSDSIYEGYIWFDAGTPFKFTAGPNWDTNWGDTGADGTLEADGDNIVAVDAGYYRLVVSGKDLTFTMEATSWGVIGDATPGGWDADTDMTYDTATDSWSVAVILTDNSFKFRANDDWAINLGDTGPDDVLEYDGDNISVASAGNYLVTLYLGTPDYTYTMEPYSSDWRNFIFSDGQSLEIDDNSDFQQGYAFPKFRNVTSLGETGSDLAFPDTDFPMFRLADVYLMYAEAVLRGGSGGDANTALGYVNQIRERAYGDATGNISLDLLNLDFILDERLRELMWEGHRRTDLVRYGKFSDTDYLWAWKGGVKEGRSVDSKYDLFPIPASDIGANPNLDQNPGY